MAHTYWRISITAVTTNTGATSNNVSIAEWASYDSSGTLISTSGGTASASNVVFGVASNAFDGNNGTWWATQPAASTGSPQWLQMQFASPVDIDHFSLTFNWNSVGYPPCNFTLQYSDDGSTWATAYSYQGGMRYASLYTNTFYTSGVVYRLNVTAIQSGTGPSVFSNIKLYDASNTLITSVLGKGFNSSWDGGTLADGTDPTQAYNNTCSNYFASAVTPSTGVPQWVALQFPSGTLAASFSFQSANATGGVADTPTAFTLQRSTDGANFSDELSATAGTWTGPCQTQTFSLTTASIVAVPSSGFQGKTYTINVVGTGTHFVAGTTTVTFSGSGGTVSSVSVTDSTHLTFSLALSGAATLGPQTITVTTGSEAPTAGFTVFAIVYLPKRDDLAWSQVRLGTDGCFGNGPFGQSTDGSGAPGLLATWDSQGNLIASGTTASSPITTVTANGS